MTPKTHHVLRPEAAGSRHSLLHMREAKSEGEGYRLAGLQLPEERTFSREEEGGGGMRARSVTKETALVFVAPALLRGES